MQIKVELIEFVEGGRTIWVQGMNGTVLRIQLPQGTGVETKRCADDKITPSHADLTIERLQAEHQVVFCLGNDLLEEECNGA